MISENPASVVVFPQVSFFINTPHPEDWIAIYESGACTSVVCGYNSSMWLYACGTQDCNTTTSEGQLTFGLGDPVETGTQGPPLDAGSYEVVLLKSGSYDIMAGPTYCSVCDATTPRRASRGSFVRNTPSARVEGQHATLSGIGRNAPSAPTRPP